MWDADRVVAELRVLNIEPDDYTLEPDRSKDKFLLTIDGATHKYTSGVNVIKACAQAVGDSSLKNMTGKGFKYTATPQQIDAVRRERLSRGLSPAVANAATSAALDAAAPGGSAAPVAALRSRAAATTRRAAGAAVANGSGSAAVGVAAALMGSHAPPAVSDVSQLDPCWLQHLENLHGEELLLEHHSQLEAWLEAKRDLQAAAAAGDKDMKDKMQHLLRLTPGTAEFDQGWQAVYREQAEALSMYQEAEKVAAARCQVVQERINQDPTARLMLYDAAFRRPSAAWWCMVQCLTAVVWWLLCIIYLACKVMLLGCYKALAAAARCVTAGLCCCLYCLRLVCMHTMSGFPTDLKSHLAAFGCVLMQLGWKWPWALMHWVGSRMRLVWCRSAACTPLAPPRRAVCVAAAANAAAMYNATAEMHVRVSSIQQYYQQQGARQGQQPPPPTAADLSIVVVGVSRLVQMEFGALHGRGECHLRDQVLRLLCGLLAAGNQDVVRSEQPMGGGRSDLVVYDLQGTPLLVVEYKQRHSGAASTRQQQDTMQLRRYLSDSRNGCSDGLLITFDKTLPNGLSATRLMRVTNPQAWAQLYNESPQHAPAFTVQPMQQLESDPLAVGVMMGLCHAYGVEVLQAC